MSNFEKKSKSIISMIIAFILLVVFSPILMLLCLTIKLTSKGPILFKQRRIGLNGEVFNILKFRTMVVDAEQLKKDLVKYNEADGPVFKIKEDPRVTKIGKFLRKSGLDELPQLLNILLGHMDLVGPRPPLEVEVEQYKQWHKKRLSVKPGITCIWQITPNRHDVTFDEWVRMDLEYINNWTFKMEFGLMFKTFLTMIRGDGH
jgi:lipopolysaccharide/colanic/teichoic acid biosynthesis glycosyltransferase